MRPNEIQREHDKPKGSKNFIGFDTEKYKTPHLRRNNPTHQCRWD